MIIRQPHTIPVSCLHDASNRMDTIEWLTAPCPAAPSSAFSPVQSSPEDCQARELPGVKSWGLIRLKFLHAILGFPMNAKSKSKPRPRDHRLVFLVTSEDEIKQFLLTQHHVTCKIVCFNISLCLLERCFIKMRSNSCDI